MIAFENGREGVFVTGDSSNIRISNSWLYNNSQDNAGQKSAFVSYSFDGNTIQNVLLDCVAASDLEDDSETTQKRGIFINGPGTVKNVIASNCSASDDTYSPEIDLSKGSRCVLGNYTTNNGDPNIGGELNGFKRRAEETGAIVWDTSTNTPYIPKPSGGWR